MFRIPIYVNGIGILITNVPYKSANDTFGILYIYYTYHAPYINIIDIINIIDLLAEKNHNASIYLNNKA